MGWASSCRLQRPHLMDLPMVSDSPQRRKLLDFQERKLQSAAPKPNSRQPQQQTHTDNIGGAKAKGKGKDTARDATKEQQQRNTPAAQTVGEYCGQGTVKAL